MNNEPTIEWKENTLLDRYAAFRHECLIKHKIGKDELGSVIQYMIFAVLDEIEQSIRGKIGDLCDTVSEM